MARPRASAMLGDEDEDFNEGLRGLPLERIIGVLGVRVRDAVGGEELVVADGKNGEEEPPGELGDEVGKGTDAGAGGGMSMREGGWIDGENLPLFIDRRRELVGERYERCGETWARLGRGVDWGASSSS